VFSAVTLMFLRDATTFSAVTLKNAVKSRCDVPLVQGGGERAAADVLFGRLRARVAAALEHELSA
jgi:hypothetical protein